MKLDHLVYATPDLDATVAQLERELGVRASAGGQHEAEATRNALIALGPDSYLEILGPDPTRPAPLRPRWFELDKLKAPRLVTWAVKASGLDVQVADAHRKGVMLGEVCSGGRLRADSVQLSWKFSNPHTIVAHGIVPFLIDWGATPHPAATAAQGVELLALRAQHPDAVRVQELLAALAVELPVVGGSAPVLIATLRTPRGQIELR